MKNTALQNRLSIDLEKLVFDRKTLQLATLTKDGMPYASYAPFALGENCLYVLISEIAVHALNLLCNPLASVLIIEDEDTAEELFARVRVNYTVKAQRIDWENTAAWEKGIAELEQRHGIRPRKLSGLRDFHLFRLEVLNGRYIKGFGQAYRFDGPSLYGEEIHHLRDGHQPRAEQLSA